MACLALISPVILTSPLELKWKFDDDISSCWFWNLTKLALGWVATLPTKNLGLEVVKSNCIPVFPNTVEPTVNFSPEGIATLPSIFSSAAALSQCKCPPEEPLPKKKLPSESK